MSGVRVAAFSKYFAIGGLCAFAMCARNAAYLIAQDSQQFKLTCDRVARYADQASALEEYVASKGVSVVKVQASMGLQWPSIR